MMEPTSSWPAACFGKEWIQDVLEVVFRHRIAGDAVARRPLILWKKQGTEQQV